MSPLPLIQHSTVGLGHVIKRDTARAFQIAALRIHIHDIFGDVGPREAGVAALFIRYSELRVGELAILRNNPEILGVIKRDRTDRRLLVEKAVDAALEKFAL